MTASSLSLSPFSDIGPPPPPPPPPPDFGLLSFGEAEPGGTTGWEVGAGVSAEDGVGAGGAEAAAAAEAGGSVDIGISGASGTSSARTNLATETSLRRAAAAAASLLRAGIACDFWAGVFVQGRFPTAAGVGLSKRKYWGQLKLNE